MNKSPMTPEEFLEILQQAGYGFAKCDVLASALNDLAIYCKDWAAASRGMGFNTAADIYDHAGNGMMNALKMRGYYDKEVEA